MVVQCCMLFVGVTNVGVLRIPVLQDECGCVCFVVVGLFCGCMYTPLLM